MANASTHPASLEAQVRAAIARVAHAKEAGTRAAAADRGLLLGHVPGWEENLEDHFSRTRCNACNASIPECEGLFHAMTCTQIPAVARALRADAEFRGFASVCKLFDVPLDYWCDGAIGYPSLRPWPRRATALRNEVNAALVLLVEPALDLNHGRAPMRLHLSELSLMRGAEPRPITTVADAAAALNHVLDARFCVGVTARGVCPGCEMPVGAATLVAHLTGCPAHPEHARAAKFERQLVALRGPTPVALAADVDATHRYRQALSRLIADCEWVSSEFGWDGEAAYLDSWAENLFGERVADARAAALDLPPPTREAH